MDTAELTRRKANYEYFRNEVYQMISHLNNAISNLETAKNKIGSCFTIDDLSSDDNRVSTIYNDLVSWRNFLQNNCIPSINQKIWSLKEAISKA